MAKQSCSFDNSLIMIITLFFLLFLVFNIRMKEGYIVAAGPIPHRRPIERIAARRAFIDANTYTPNIDITPFNNRW
tara:strand:- start:1628 stop:1855 length:228 start_codon:yes stop_codon:yes gene_type:complete